MSGGGPARSRELRKQGKETLRRLLEAAIVVFDERGYSGARIDDIVKEANTSHGTFYLYFANKESLPSIKASKEGFDELREWLGRFYDLYDHYHPVIRAWTDINTQNSDMARTGAVVLRRFTDQLVRRVREIHPPPVSDPETAALAMVSMIERATFYAVVRLVPVDRDALLDNLATILHVGLFAGSRRRRPPGPRR
jgi:AcrR family transcriptional regulator